MTKILFFGPLKDIMGFDVKDVNLPNSVSNRSQLVAWLAQGNADVAEALNAISVRLVIDNEIVAQDADLSMAKEIAFLPPLSGG